MGEPHGPAKPFYMSLYFRVLVAIALGVAVGSFWPATGAKLAPLGEGFIKLIKLTIGPLIFCTIARWCKDLDAQKMATELAAGPPPSTT